MPIDMGHTLEYQSLIWTNCIKDERQKAEFEVACDLFQIDSYA